MEHGQRRAEDSSPASVAGVAPLASVAGEAGVDLSTRYLLRRLGVVEQRVAALVRVRRASDPNPDDPLRSMVLGDAEVDRLLRPAAQVDPPLVEAGDELLRKSSARPKARG